MHRGAQMAEDRALPARHDGRQPPPLPRHHRPTHHIHAAVNPAQPPRPGTQLHRARAQPHARSCASDTTPHCRAASSATATSRGVLLLSKHAFA